MILMKHGPLIIKIGGSLIHHDHGQVLRQLGKVISQFSERYPLIIVPGGGPFADKVREYGQQFILNDSTCHFMALLAMDQFAYLLKELIPGSVLTELSSPNGLDFTEEDPSWPRGPSLISAPRILLSSRYISQLPQTALPHSWDVTSDSIAAYLANQLGASQLVFVKSIDIDPDLKVPDVDPYFHNLISWDIPIWFLNGLYPGRLTQLLETGHAPGVCLTPKA